MFVMERQRPSPQREPCAYTNAEVVENGMGGGTLWYGHIIGLVDVSSARIDHITEGRLRKIEVLLPPDLMVPDRSIQIEPSRELKAQPQVAYQRKALFLAVIPSIHDRINGGRRAGSGEVPIATTRPRLGMQAPTAGRIALALCGASAEHDQGKRGEMVDGHVDGIIWITWIALRKYAISSIPVWRGSTRSTSSPSFYYGEHCTRS